MQIDRRRRDADAGVDPRQTKMFAEAPPKKKKRWPAFTLEEQASWEAAVMRRAAAERLQGAAIPPGFMAEKLADAVTDHARAVLGDEVEDFTVGQLFEAGLVELEHITKMYAGDPLTAAVAR